MIGPVILELPNKLPVAKVLVLPPNRMPLLLVKRLDPLPNELANIEDWFEDGMPPKRDLEATSLLDASLEGAFSADLAEFELENMLLNNPTPWDCLKMSNWKGDLNNG